MNLKMRRTIDGANLDIRLPGIAGKLGEMDACQIAKINLLHENKSEQTKSEKVVTKKPARQKPFASQTKTIDFSPPLLIPIKKKK